jgi:molybdopterin-containing oxidoreductase family iron-sulfur binding subunit
MAKSTRRGFLKLAGVAAVGLGTKPVYDAFARRSAPEQPVPPAEALTAKRWAMVVDTRKCLREEGCTDCIQACHAIHNVPDFGNPKDEIKWVWKEQFEHGFPEQHNEFMADDLKHKDVLLMCNHCDNPPCVRVCPTQATWKREDDGIVMMDMHRCIGCRYCMAACPYGSRSFNWRDPRTHIAKIDDGFPTRMRGVVEKCNFCAERLVRGQIPACVEACEAGALAFGDLEDPDSEVRDLLSRHFNIRRKPGLGTQPEVYYIV